MDLHGWQDLIPIGFAIVGIYTVLMWAGNGVGWAVDRLRKRRGRRDVLSDRIDGLEHRMDNLEGGVGRVIELLEAQAKKELTA